MLDISSRTLINHLNPGHWNIYRQSLVGQNIFRSAIDLLYAYAHATLDDELVKLTGFSSCDKQFALNRGFTALNVFQSFSQKSLFFKGSIRQGFALVLLMIFYSCKTPNHICCNISNNLMILLKKNNEGFSLKYFYHACH